MYLYVCECVLLTARVVRMPFHRWDRRMVVCVSECASSRHQGCCILWDSACRRRPVEWLGRWPRSCPLSVLLCSCSCASACWSVGDGRCLRDLGSVGLRCVPHLPPHCCCSWRWTWSWGPAGPGYWKGSMTMWDRVGRVTSWHPKSVQWSSKLLGSRWWLLEVLLVGICLAEYLVGERTTK